MTTPNPAEVGNNGGVPTFYEPPQHELVSEVNQSVSYSVSQSTCSREMNQFQNDSISNMSFDLILFVIQYSALDVYHCMD
jgi:hypothetical protein